MLLININNTDWDKLQKEDIEQAIRDGEESFFFEFKDDRVDTKKIVQEISALANTYGGYILIGVSDNKEIDGCTNWNEQKIHITIHESLSPIPPFDVKKFVFDDEKTVYVIKVDKGLEPPYITNRGMIYERVSSGSFVVKDSSKLTQMYYQRENELKRIEEKISIPPNTETIGNLFGYIDVGFQFYSTNIKAMQDAFFRFDINDYNNKLDEDASHPSISRVGNTIVCVFNGLSADRKKWLPANANYFMEIMCDGSVKYRTLLLDSDEKENHVNILVNNSLAKQFEELYYSVFGEVIEKQFIGAKKYEKLTTLLQFVPFFNYGKSHVEYYPELRDRAERMQVVIEERRKVNGIDKVISSSRIPSYGLYTLDKKWFSDNNLPMTAEEIAKELFDSSFNWLGYLPEFSEINKAE